MLYLLRRNDCCVKRCDFFAVRLIGKSITKRLLHQLQLLVYYSEDFLKSWEWLVRFFDNFMKGVELSYVCLESIGILIRIKCIVKQRQKTITNHLRRLFHLKDFIFLGRILFLFDTLCFDMHIRCHISVD